jgi:small subunit ribosomal protein S6
VKRYEGLFILNTAGKEEALKDTIDKISADITGAGGKVETVQKMDKRSFTRVTDKRHTSGFYVNVIFHADPSAITNLRKHFGLKEDVFRVMFTIMPAVEPAAAAAVTT